MRALVMNIQAISSVFAPKSCQPIRNVGFAKKTEQVEKPEQVEKSELPELMSETPETDTFTPAEPGTAEQKYNMACLLAAYYKNQYETLAKQGCCNA